MTTSPYADKPESSWLSITQQLVNSHPLKSAELLDVATTAWATLWQTTVGTGSLSVRLSELKVPATVVGYFFEVLLAREHTPVLLLDGVGPSTAEQMAQLGIITIGDLLCYEKELPRRLSRIKEKNQKFLDECMGIPRH